MFPSLQRPLCQPILPRSAGTKRQVSGPSRRGLTHARQHAIFFLEDSFPPTAHQSPSLLSQDGTADAAASDGVRARGTSKHRKEQAANASVWRRGRKFGKKEGKQGLLCAPGLILFQRCPLPRRASNAPRVKRRSISFHWRAGEHRGGLEETSGIFVRRRARSHLTPTFFLPLTLI